MKKRVKPGNSRRKIAIGLFVLIAFSFIVYVGVMQYQPQTPKTVAEYFEVTDAAVEPTGNERIDQNGTVWVIYGISFTFKPTLGDAHAVVVKGWANSEDDPIGDLSKNQSRTVVMISETGLAIRQNKDGRFPVTVTIDSLEARGPLTFYLAP